MENISFDNTMSIFCRITGIDKTSPEWSQTIENAVSYIRQKLCVTELDSVAAARCEYAAAAVAVYDYTAQRQLSDRILLTENGTAYNGAYSPKSLEAAQSFRKYALANLRGLVGDDEFLFAGVGVVD